MPLPYSFSNNTTPTGPQLDACLAALGAVGVIPCTMTGSSNTLVAVPLSSAPSVPSYSTLQAFAAVSSAGNTGPTTLQIGTLASLNVYRDAVTGPVVLEGGELVPGNSAVFLYDGALNNNLGGFHLVNPTQMLPLSFTSVVNSTSGTTLGATQLTGGITRQGIIDRTGTNSGGFNDTTDTAVNIISDLPGSLPGFTTFRFRYWNNSTSQTATLVGGANVTISGPATIANNASHDFIGVVTQTSPTPSVTIFG